MKKSFVRGTWQVKRAFSPCVITEGGGRTIYVAGHTGQVDDSGKSLAADFDAQFKQTFRNIGKSDFGETVIGLAIPGKAVGHHHHPLRLSIPFPDQNRAG